MTDTNLQDDIAAIRSMVSGEGSAKVSKKDKILERVRAILALADDEQIRNPQAADNYRAQADNLMTAYAIEQWQIELKPEGSVRPEPEVRYVSFDWWYRSQFSNDLYTMFHDVARHCRVVVAHRGHGRGEHSYHEMPVIGLASDIDYFDMLFTHLMVQMGRQLEPKPISTASFGENAYTLRASGMARPRIAKLLYDEGMIPGTGEGTDYWDELTGQRKDYYRLPPNKEKALRAKVRVAGEKYGQKQGFEKTTIVNPKVWQRSFSRGFVREIGDRLWAMRRTQESMSSGTGTSTAVALRDIYDVAVNFYDELWPPPPPVKVETTEIVRKGRRSTAMVRGPKMSTRAMEAGRAAGRKADLQNRPSERIGGRKGLPGGS